MIDFDGIVRHNDERASCCKARGHCFMVTLGRAFGSGELAEDLPAPNLTLLGTSRSASGVTITYSECESAIGVHEGF